jgi:hypothetical protein
MHEHIHAPPPTHTHTRKHARAQVGALLSVVRDIALTPAQAKEVIRKAINCARTAELQQLPPILYHVLLVSAGGPCVYALVKISDLFEQLGRQSGNGGPGSVLLQVRARWRLLLLPQSPLIGNEVQGVAACYM